MAEKEKGLMDILGREIISDDSRTLEAYSTNNCYTPPRKPRLVVKPSNVDEVQRLVKWANRTHTALVPVSSGPPHFRGDTVPSVESAVIVDLSRMKRIIRIDRRNRIAIIEPGVTYDELQPELAKKGLRLSTPLSPRRSKSIVASLLEREPILTPKYQWTLMEPLRCLEVVWGDGSKMWTGEAGEYTSQDLAEQQRTYRSAVVGMGPGNVDYYRLLSASQGTMGIVTWASIKCDILPQLHRIFFLPANKVDDLIDCAYHILKIRYGDEILILNSANLAYILAKGNDEISLLKEQLPPWVMVVGIAGRKFLPKERVEYQEKDLTDIAQRFGLKLMPVIPGAKDIELVKVLLNASKEPYWKLRYKGGFQDIFFLTTLNRTPAFISTMYSIAKLYRYASTDLGVYIQPLQQGVSCHCEFTLPYNSNDREDASKVKQMFIEGSKALLKEGAYFSRPYGIWADMTYDKDPQTTMLLKKIKVLFDPNGILNPGKLCF